MKTQNKEIKINEIVIGIGKKEIRLSPDEAKQLAEQLNKLFLSKVVHEHHHDWPLWDRYTYKTRPILGDWNFVTTSDETTAYLNIKDNTAV